jgi:hypothetical protein
MYSYEHIIGWSGIHLDIRSDGMGKPKLTHRKRKWVKRKNRYIKSNKRRRYHEGIVFGRRFKSS